MKPDTRTTAELRKQIVQSLHSLRMNCKDEGNRDYLIGLQNDGLKALEELVRRAG